MAMWNCTEFEIELQRCLDARRPLSSLALAPGSIHCLHCRGVWERFLLLEQALTAWNCDSAESGFSDAVVARVLLDAEPSVSEGLVAEAIPDAGTPERSPAPPSKMRWREVARPSRRGGRGAAVVAAAAIVLLASLAPLLRAPENRVAAPPRPPDRMIAQEADIRPTQKGNPAADRDLQFLLRDAGTVYSVLAHQARTTVADATSLVPKASTRPTSPDNAVFSDVTPAWVDDWSRDLKPIGQDVQQALGFLFDAVAVEDDTSI